MASDIPVDPFSAVFRRFFCPFFIAVPASPSEIRISFRLGSAVRRRSLTAKYGIALLIVAEWEEGFKNPEKDRRMRGADFVISLPISRLFC